VRSRLAFQGSLALAVHRTSDLPGLERFLKVRLPQAGKELRGISSLELEEIAQSKKQIMSSRSFGVPVDSIGGAARVDGELPGHGSGEAAAPEVGRRGRPMFFI
jgi:hypothetical protein